jgi:hypothetical protein
VPSTPSKKQRILDYCQSQGLDRVGTEEIRAIGNELRRRLGPSHKTSPSYIASVLRAAGKRVEYEDRYADPSMEEPYASRLKGLLQFRDLASAEASLQKLDALYREFREVTDRVGTSLVRSLVLKGKLRAQSLAANPRVSPGKRQEKLEIARWFHVWLETPDLIYDWLELRKGSEEFQRMFSSENASTREDSPAEPE